MMNKMLTKNFRINNFVPTIVWVKENDSFHTRLCVYNYFSELYPGVQDGAKVYLWFFNNIGEEIAHRCIELPFKGQLQFELSELNLHFEGTVGLCLIPNILPEGNLENVGTGYYVYYHDNNEHADMSHEWEQMKFTYSKSSPWLCVIRPDLFPDIKLIVMNCYYGLDEIGTADWEIRIRNGKGKILMNKLMPKIPPRGSVCVEILSLFPTLKNISKQEIISVEVLGSNIQGPFTFVSIPNGDFNIHHFC
jgi:hypothetical protein